LPLATGKISYQGHWRGVLPLAAPCLLPPGSRGRGASRPIELAKRPAAAAGNRIFRRRCPRFWKYLIMNKLYFYLREIARK